MLTAKMINVLLSNGLKLQTCRVGFVGQKSLFSEISSYSKVKYLSACYRVGL